MLMLTIFLTKTVMAQLVFSDFKNLNLKNVNKKDDEHNKRE